MIRLLKGWIGQSRRYAAADDPRVATANSVALLLAWNTPFYPLYLIWAAGAAAMPGALLTLCAFPVFLAIPSITARHALAGRVFLAIVTVMNTVFCTWLLGESSGTQLFLLPCIILAALLFRRSERVALLGLLSLPLLAGVLLDGRYPPSPFVCTGSGCGTILWMNTLSVAILLAFFGYLMSGFDQSGNISPTLKCREGGCGVSNDSVPRSD